MHFGQNPNGLRTILTGRTEDEINSATDRGLRPLLLPVTPGNAVYAYTSVYQCRETGRVMRHIDPRFSLPATYEPVLQHIVYYPYQFPSPFAAYLIPSDLTPGERVWLDDVIEDIVAVHLNHGGTTRLESAEAIWNGDRFEICFDPTKDVIELIG